MMRVVEVRRVLDHFAREGKPAIASVDLSVGTVQGFDLRVIPEESLFRWHANIEGWGSKAEEKQKMLLLANAAFNFRFLTDTT